jgi:hypothetical protein
VIIWPPDWVSTQRVEFHFIGLFYKGNLIALFKMRIYSAKPSEFMLEMSKFSWELYSCYNNAMLLSHAKNSEILAKYHLISWCKKDLKTKTKF